MVRRFLVAVLLVLIIYFTWAYFGRGVSHTYDYEPVTNVVEFNAPGRTGNVVGVQAHMTTWDYTGAEAFLSKLEYYMSEVQEQGWIGDRTVVVFPENIGTPLVAVGEKEFVYSSTTISDASRKMILSNLITYASTRYGTADEVRDEEVLFRMKASSMLRAYVYAFSKVAEEYEVTIVAGSITLPDPEITEGQIELGDGPLRNVSVTFHPDGSIDNFLSYGLADALDMPSGDRSFALESKLGQIGLLTCPEMWEEDTYAALSKAETKVVIVPSCDPRNTPWPRDQEVDDIINMKRSGVVEQEEEPWYTFPVAQTMANDIPNAIAVYLCGDLWDLNSTGSSFAVAGGDIFLNPGKDQEPGIYSLWVR